MSTSSVKKKSFEKDQVSKVGKSKRERKGEFHIPNHLRMFVRGFDFTLEYSSHSFVFIYKKDLVSSLCSLHGNNLYLSFKRILGYLSLGTVHSPFSSLRIRPTSDRNGFPVLILSRSLLQNMLNDRMEVLGSEIFVSKVFSLNRL